MSDEGRSMVMGQSVFEMGTVHMRLYLSLLTIDHRPLIMSQS
jgi:hypothetical protein